MKEDVRKLFRGRSTQIERTKVTPVENPNAAFLLPMYMQMLADELVELINFSKDVQHAGRLYIPDCYCSLRAAQKEVFRMYPKQQHELLYEVMDEAAEVANDTRMMMYNTAFTLLEKHTDGAPIGTHARMFTDFCMGAALAYIDITGKEFKKLEKLVFDVARFLGYTELYTDGNLTTDDVKAATTPYFIKIRNMWEETFKKYNITLLEQWS